MDRPIINTLLIFFQNPVDTSFILERAAKEDFSIFILVVICGAAFYGLFSLTKALMSLQKASTEALMSQRESINMLAKSIDGLDEAIKEVPSTFRTEIKELKDLLISVLKERRTQ